MKRNIRLAIIIFSISIIFQESLWTVCASEIVTDESITLQLPKISGMGEELYAPELSDSSEFDMYSDSDGDKTISKRQDFEDFVLEAGIKLEKGTGAEDELSAHSGLLFRISRDKKTGRYNGQNYAKLDVADDTFASAGIGMFDHVLQADYSNLKISAYTEKEIAENESYLNPVLDKCADPDILYDNGTYYLYCTTPNEEGNSGIKVYTSTDLAHWTEQGFAFFKGDGWGNSGFWAPDIIERDGIFYMYYAADEHLCVATSDSPLGPFKQDVYEPMHEYIKEIDAHAFYDEASDKYYLYFVRFTAGNVIWGAELNDDMKSIKEDTLTQISRANQGWDEDMLRVNEGPYMLVKDGKYYMTYSGSHFESINYGAGYAVADSPLGPFTKYENNPIMQSNSLVHGAGHHCVAASPDGKELFMVYHCHHSLVATDPRRLCIDRMQFTEDADGNTILEVKGPTVTPQEIPSGAVDTDNFIEIGEKDLEPVNVNRSMTIEEIKAQLPAEILIRTSRANKNPAIIVWNLDDDIMKDSGEETVVKGMVTLPESVDNLGNIPLDVEIKMIFDIPEPDIGEWEGGGNNIWFFTALGIAVVVIGRTIKYFREKGNRKNSAN